MRVTNDYSQAGSVEPAVESGRAGFNYKDGLKKLSGLAITPFAEMENSRNLAKG